MFSEGGAVGGAADSLSHFMMTSCHVCYTYQHFLGVYTCQNAGYTKKMFSFQKLSDVSICLLAIVK